MKTTNLRKFTRRLGSAIQGTAPGFIRLALALALTSNALDAATLRWTGGHATSSEWGRPANWDLGVAPQDGDTLVFPSGAARLTNTNNLANLELVAIRFSGAGGGYNIYGNGVTLTNSITATNVAGINTIQLARLNLGKDLPFNAAQAGNTLIVESDIRLGGNDLLVNGPGRLELLGVISGNGNITKTNTGVLVVGGTSANTYVGEFKVDEGQVELSKTAGLAVTGMLTVGDGLGGSNADVVRNTQDNQVNKVTVKGSGLWELAGHTEEVSELTLAGGGDIQTGPAGLLRLGIGADVLVTPNPTPLGTASSISGRLELLLGGHTFTITDGLATLSDGSELLIDAEISGLGALTKAGSGDLALTGNNSYAGLTKVEGGELRISTSAALGSTLSGTQILNDGSLQLLNNITVVDEKLTLNSTGTSLPLNNRPALSSIGNNVWEGDLVLEQDARIGVATGGSLELSGVISGAFGITKEDAGTLRFSGSNPNTFSGDVNMKEGTLELDKGTIGGTAVAGKLIVGDGIGTAQSDKVKSLKSNQVSDVTVNGTGFWDLNNREEEVHQLTLNDGGDVSTGNTGNLRIGIGGDILVTPDTEGLQDVSRITGKMELLLGSHTLEVSEGRIEAQLGLIDNPELAIEADIAGLGAITKTGNGDLSLAGSNSFSGLVTVEGGELWVENDLALGTTFSGTRIENDAILKLGGVTVVDETLRLNSPGKSGLFGEPTLLVVGTNLWQGPIEMLQTARIGVLVNGELDAKGPISGVGGVTKENAGHLLYSGFQGNTYTGPTKVAEGTLRLSKGILDNALKGSLEIGGDATNAPAATVACVNLSQLPQITAVIVRKTGQWTFSSEKIASLAGSGNVVNGLFLRTGFDNSDTLYSGVMSGNGSLFKHGTGTWTMQGANTLSGLAWVVEGGLVIDGSLESSTVLMLSNASLGGNGSVQNVLAGPQSTLTPGASPGKLSTRSLALLPNSTLRMDINGTQPGAEHDQIKVQGLVDLGGANLDLKLGYVPTVGQKLVLIDNDGNDPVIDAFNGLPEGSIIRLNNLPFEITYTGGDGNDVVLEYNDSAVSVSQATVTAEGGNGNAIIDRNECNFLNIELRNERNLPLIVTRAVLDSLTPGVLVTQQEGDYAAFGPLETRINTTPFKISTMENFECGRTIQLQLTLSINGGTTFSLPVSLPSGTAGILARYDQPLNVAIPDNGQATSTLNVSNAAPYIGKVTVGLHITHPAAGDLVLRLRSPHGTTVRLATQLGGAVDDYGASCSPITQRTLFDDDATNKIAAATAPFVGAFVPEEELAKFIGEDPNGDWKLLIDDTVTGDTGILECWSLGIAPAECADGGGDCESCTPALAGNFDASSPVLTTYLAPSGDRSLCGVSNTCPGSVTGPARRYGIHTLTETSSKARCITIQAVADCGRNTGLIRAVAYAGSFDPANPCLNYLGDSGGLPFAAHANFSVELPANQNLVVVVYDQDGAGACDRYTLEVHGLPCPAPVLTIQMGTAPNTVDLEWSTSYPGYQLKQRSTLDETSPPQVRDVTETPVIVNGVYRVTLPSTDPRRFFWLEKR